MSKRILPPPVRLWGWGRNMSFSPRPGLFRPLAIALLSGMVMALALEPVAAWPLAWIALAPVWVLILGDVQSSWFNRRTLLLGAAWGLGYYGLLQFWITGLHPLTWMGVPWLASVAIALFCWITTTVLATGWFLIWVVLLRGSALLGDLWRRDGKWLRASTSGLSPGAVDHVAIQALGQAPGQAAGLWRSSQRVLLGVALWCSLDLLWRHTFLYWSSLALTQSPHNLVILHLDQWAGPNAVAAAIVAVNGFLAEAWLWWPRPSFRDRPMLDSPRARLHPASPTSGRTSVTCGAIACALFLGLHGLGALQFASDLAPASSAQLDRDAVSFPQIPDLNSTSEPLLRPLHVGLIQGHVPTSIKLYDEGLRRAFMGYTEGYDALVDQGVDVVLTPEGAFPIIWSGSTPSRTPLYRAVRDRQVPVWLGTFVPQGRDFTQSLITLNGDGDIVSRYNKVKLVPLGEYIPFESVLGALVDRLSPLDSYMIPGQPGQTFDTPWGRAIVGICYESAFPQLFRQQARAGGEFILTASNNDPYSTAMMAQHHAQDVLRAIETDRWAVRATNTGYSGIVDHHGRTRWRSQAQVYQIHHDIIDRRRSVTIYVRWGDWLTPLLMFGAIASLAVSGLKRLSLNPP